MSSTERFWDLHVIASDGSYDFVDQIEAQIQYQHREHDVFRDVVNLVNVNGQSHTIDGGQPNVVHALPPEGGVVSSAVTVDALNGVTACAPHTALCRWISDLEYVGKLRINAHGDGRGNVFMPPDEGRVNAQNIVRWLQANGLGKPIWDPDAQEVVGGLGIVCLAVCMGAMYETEAPEWSLTEGAYVAADLSAVDRVAKSFTMIGHRFVRVTGSNELVTTDDGQWKRRNPLGTGMTDGWDYDDSTATDPENPKPVVPRNVFRVDRYKGQGAPWCRLVVPAEFTACCRRRQCAILLPRLWTISGENATRGPAGGGWTLVRGEHRIDIREGFIVDEERRRITVPLGFDIGGAAGSLSDVHGGDLWRVSGHNSFVWRGAFGQAQRLTHTDYKVVAIS